MRADDQRREYNMQRAVASSSASPLAFQAKSVAQIVVFVVAIPEGLCSVLNEDGEEVNAPHGQRLLQ